MENLYIDGDLLITTSERVVFNDITMYATKPKIVHREIITDETGIYTISDSSYANSVFLNLYVSGGITFNGNDLYMLAISLYPKLKSELDDINHTVLDKLEASQTVYKMVLMGYFAQFELYLMEMVLLFVLFDENHINTFISCIKDDDIKGIYRKDCFYRKMLEVMEKTSLYDKVRCIKKLIPEMFIYHQFDDVKKFFKSVYSIEMPSFRVIKDFYHKYRHDLMHRNGKNTEDSTVYISRSLVNEVYKEMVEYSVKFDAIKNQELQLEE